MDWTLCEGLWDGQPCHGLQVQNAIMLDGSSIEPRRDKEVNKEGFVKDFALA